MSKIVVDVMQFVKDEDVKFVDFCFMDMCGKEQYVLVLVLVFDEDKFESGYVFDGLLIVGWKGIEVLDMLFMLDLNVVFIDLFYEELIFVLICDVVELVDGKGYECDLCLFVKCVEVYLKSMGIGDMVYFGLELEFFIFDLVQWNMDMLGCFVKINLEEVLWLVGKEFEGGNMGYCLGMKGGYFLVVLVDMFQDMCLEMCLLFEQFGILVEVYYYEVVGQGQNEIGMKFLMLVECVDWMQWLKYIIYNVVYLYGKMVMFMLKLVVGDNGLGMYVYQLIWKDGQNLFVGNGYVGLLELVLFYIGGIIKYVCVLNVIMNLMMNLYKCLVLYFEVLVKFVYLVCNCLVLICILYVLNLKGCCIEMCFLDLMVNLYLLFLVLMMVGFDGIQNKIYLGEVVDKNLYDLLLEEDVKILIVCVGFDQVFEVFDKDCEFLICGGVFMDSMFDVYFVLKEQELVKFCMMMYLIEFEMYYLF